MGVELIVKQRIVGGVVVDQGDQVKCVPKEEHHQGDMGPYYVLGLFLHDAKGVCMGAQGALGGC